jgi:hypothetical protein
MSRFHADDLPTAPPPEVLSEIDVAWERAQELFRSELELHFEKDEHLGRVWAELRLPDGTVAEILSATEALALGCGEPVDEPALVA